MAVSLLSSPAHEFCRVKNNGSRQAKTGVWSDSDTLKIFLRVHLSIREWHFTSAKNGVRRCVDLSSCGLWQSSSLRMMRSQRVYKRMCDTRAKVTSKQKVAKKRIHWDFWSDAPKSPYVISFFRSTGSLRHPLPRSLVCLVQEVKKLNILATKRAI